MFSHPDDPLSVIEVRKFQRARIREWVEEANAQARKPDGVGSSSRARSSEREDTSSFPYLARNYFAAHPASGGRQRVQAAAEASVRRAGSSQQAGNEVQTDRAGWLSWVQASLQRALRLARPEQAVVASAARPSSSRRSLMTKP